METGNMLENLQHYNIIFLLLIATFEIHFAINSLKLLMTLISHHEN